MPKRPFDLGAAVAVKIGALDERITFQLGGAEFSLPTAATWDEDKLKATASKSPFDVLREEMGKAEYDRLVEASAGTSRGKFDFITAQELFRYYMEASGLGGPGESSASSSS